MRVIVLIGYGVVKENVCGGMRLKFVASVNNLFMNFLVQDSRNGKDP
jgi:hypothetical protein